MDWDKLRIFHAAADAGSFTHAGEALNMSQSAVSRQVSSLEEHLKTPLFHRHARGLLLTEQGEMLYETVTDVMAKLKTAETLLSDSKTKPSGDLVISAPVGIGTVWITQRLREFIEIYPEVRIELLVNDIQSDISKREADVGIWIADPDNPDLIRRRLFTMNVHVYASPTYLRRFGAPKTLESLDDHRIVSYSGDPAKHLGAIRWIETAGRKDKKPRLVTFRANSIIAMKYAIRSGLGIGMLPDYLADGEPDLLPVLTEIDPPKMPVHFVYPAELKNSKKVQILRDFLVAKSRKWQH